MTDENAERARAWYRLHKTYVNKMLAKLGSRVEPSGSDASKPELWKDIHWRWFMEIEVRKQIGF